MANLSNIFTYYSTNSLSRDQLSESGLIKNIHYGDIHKKYGCIVDSTKDISTYIKDINYNNRYQICKENDLIFADASEDYEGIGKAIELKNVNNLTIISGLHTILARDENNNFAPKFKGYLFNTPKVHNQIKVLANGFKVFGISKSIINQLVIYIPSKSEQEKISDMLLLLDQKIELQSKKIEVLKLYKKGICTSIFAQNENYDYKLLSDLDIYISDGNYGEMYPNSNELKDNGDIPFIRVNNLKNLRLTTENMKYISAKKHQILLSGHLKENDILITTRGEIGKVAIVDKKFVDANINAQIALLRVNNRSLINPYFILEYLNYNNKYIQSFQTGSALKQLPIKNLKKLKIPELNIDKQNKIGRYFNMYNYKLMLENNKLNKLRELKKRLMQNMFV